MECCPSFKLARTKDRPRLLNTRRQQRVLYFYFLDSQLGLIHVRLTTWFPFSVQIYVNGHSWLAQQMLQQRLGFTQQDNAFTALDDPPSGSETGRFVRRPELAHDGIAQRDQGENGGEVSDHGLTPESQRRKRIFKPGPQRGSRNDSAAATAMHSFVGGGGFIWPAG